MPPKKAEYCPECRQAFPGRTALVYHLEEAHPGRWMPGSIEGDWQRIPKLFRSAWWEKGGAGEHESGDLDFDPDEPIQEEYKQPKHLNKPQKGSKFLSAKPPNKKQKLSSGYIPNQPLSDEESPTDYELIDSPLEYPDSQDEQFQARMEKFGEPMEDDETTIEEEAPLIPYRRPQKRKKDARMQVNLFEPNYEPFWPPAERGEFYQHDLLLYQEFVVKKV